MRTDNESVTILKRIRSLGIRSPEDLAEKIDHTVLGVAASREEVMTRCEEAVRHRFCNICVNPYYVAYAAQRTAGTSVGVCVATGFPYGQNTTEVKALEASRAREDGASEIDVVLNVAAVVNSDYEYVRREIAAVVAAARPCPVKVVFEVAFLSREQIVQVCRICEEAGVAWVKTATGTIEPGATVAAVELMRESVSQKVGVKAAGGVRSLFDAVEMLQAGAGRLGASASVSILHELESLFATSSE